MQIMEFTYHNLHLHRHPSHPQTQIRPQQYAHLLLVLICYKTEPLDRFSLHNPLTGESTELVIPPLFFETNGPVSYHFDMFGQFGGSNEFATLLFEERNKTPSLKFHALGTCNGLVCLFSYPVIDLPKVTIIWNPCIRKYVILPMPSGTVGLVEYEEFCFGYDSINNDYKVLRCTTETGKVSQCQIEVYSLAWGDWKRVSPDVVPVGFIVMGFGAYVLLNNAVHWFQDQGADNLIVSFDMCNEVFSEMMVPEALIKQRENINISRYEESLAFVTIDEIGVAEAMVHIWVMEEYGVMESWNKLYSVVVGYANDNFQPLGFTRRGEIILDVNLHPSLEASSRGMVYVDPTSSRVKESGIEGVRWCSFVESLVLLDQANAISY